VIEAPGRVAVLGLALAGFLACRPRDKAAPEPTTKPAGAASSRPPWDAGSGAPAVPEGMVRVPPGALVAGTPLGMLPRIADQEMPGEQVILKGFFISIYPYPNEEAAIPIASVTRDEAAHLCEARGQRLCTELEWERACKGPDNHTYEYGDRYRAEVCGTGAQPRMLPSGLRVACRSDFGVRDMHGSIAEWTSSPWARGSKGNLATVRGGNGPAGEIFGRCAHASGHSPTTRSQAIGFRCCQGPVNEAEVSLVVVRKQPLEIRTFEGDPALRKIESLLPDEARLELRSRKGFRLSREWTWHPIGNEELVAVGGCSSELVKRICGVVVARRKEGDPDVLAWAGSGRYLPTVRIEPDPRYLWVYGGDERSHYRTLLHYAWGRVLLGETQRNVKNPK